MVEIIGFWTLGWCNNGMWLLETLGGPGNVYCMWGIWIIEDRCQTNRQTSQMAPNVFNLLLSTSLCNPLSVMWAEINDLFLINRIFQRQWDSTSKIRLKKTVTSIWLSLSCSHLLAVINQAAMFELHYEEVHVAKNCGWPQTNN